MKGHDRATVEITSEKHEESCEREKPVDEISAYFDGRYICALEAAYQIFGFPIHYRSISVQRLSFHLPGEKSVTFKETESLDKVARHEKYRHSKLENFSELNAQDLSARQYTYDEIPHYYVWNDTYMISTVWKKGRQIGRLLYTHHSSGKLWHLRLLLSTVHGPTLYQHLKTINDHQYHTFKDACKQLGLLNDDNEWHEVLEERAKCKFPNQIQELFVHIIVNYEVTHLRDLWNRHWKHMVDDLLPDRRKKNCTISSFLDDKQ